MAFFENLVNGLEHDGERASIIAMARQVFALFGGVFASIELDGSLGSPPMTRLDGQRVAITCAASDLGSDVAARLRHAGAHVIAIDQVEARCCDAMIVTDLADPAALSRLAAELAEVPPDVLVNLSEIQPSWLHGGQAAAALASLDTINLTVPAILARAVAGPMKLRGSGQIVNVGSALGAIHFSWFAACSSSTTGLAALSQALRRELAGSGVCVTHINSRPARTAFNSTDADGFLEVTGTKGDEPEWVADRIVDAILARRGDVFLVRAERFRAMLNAIAPRLIDRILARQMRRAHVELS